MQLVLTQHVVIAPKVSWVLSIYARCYVLNLYHYLVQVS